MKSQNKTIFVLTGAGVSRESGIKTFREKDGLWDNHKIEDVCTIEAFIKNPDYVNNFYNKRRKALAKPNIKPNEAHLNLAKFEKNHSDDFLLVTQNIDDLHEKAGSKNVLHMHGTLNEGFCMNCNFFFKLDFDITSSYVCKNCRKIGQSRVDVVWFGEQPKHLEKIYSFLNKADMFISIGTSNNVYPAAGFIDYITQFNPKAKLVEFNIEKTAKSSLFEKTYLGPASETVPKFVNSFLEH
tara:strand:- start:138 stop:857 length:720 start_codon:yes stop_codon:yes gene_type:complete